MAPTPKSLVPMAHVKDVERSVSFYSQLGFEVRNTFTPEGSSTLAWAFLESQEARLMLAAAGEPVLPEQQAVLFYIYLEDVKSAHAELTAAGLEPGPISFPFYCPKGEFRLQDPDGYVLMVTHV